jgi:hypothetical protein
MPLTHMPAGPARNYTPTGKPLPALNVSDDGKGNFHIHSGGHVEGIYDNGLHLRVREPDGYTYRWNKEDTVMVDFQIPGL